MSDPAQEFEQDVEEKLEELKVVDVSILESLEGLKDQNQGGERKFTPENKPLLEPQLLKESKFARNYHSNRQNESKRDC